MVSVAEVRAIPGRGLQGDRYFQAAGTFSNGHEPDSELTLIESEAIEALAREHSLVLQPADARRNLVTRGVALNGLAGREFTIGDVRVLAHGLCEPCEHLRRLTGHAAILKGLVNRGGLRVQILAEGTLRVGDAIRPRDATVAAPFDRQPTLSGSLVRLRPLRAEDHDALFAVASDPLIWEQHPDKSRSQPDGFRTFFDAGLASGGALLALDASTGAVIGTSRFDGYDPVADEVEIGWTFLARSHWGGQYNRAMKDLMLQHAFRFVGHVVFIIGSANYRSQRAVEKIGATRVSGRQAPAGRTGGVVFQMAAEDYRSPQRMRGQP